MTAMPFVLVFLVTILPAEFQKLQLTCTYLQFGVGYSIPSNTVLRSLAVDCTNGFSMDISRKFRRVTSGTLPVPTSMKGDSNCTLSGTFRKPIDFLVISFVDAFCNFPEIKMSAEVSANISVSTSINCNVTSSQHVNITWIKDGYDLIADSNMEIHEVFLDNSPYSLVTISTIEFLAVQSSDSGWYNCTMASINNVSSASSAVYLSIQKDPVSTTEELTAISTSIASTVATTSDDIQEDGFNIRIFYTSIGTLLAVFVLVTTSVAIAFMKYSWQRTTREEKIYVPDCAYQFPRAHKEKELKCMETMATISQSTTPILFMKIEHFTIESAV